MNLRSSFAVVAVTFALTALPPAAIACHCTGESKDLVDTAASAGKFNTLIKAAKAAGLVETLRSDGPLTVFAPTDDAFARLPAATLTSLLKNREQLKAVLLYHVVPGRVTASDVVKLSSAKTVLGQSVSVDTSHGVRINNASVVKTDIEASNGVIHVINRVLMPDNDLIETARAAGAFTTLLTAIEAADLTDALRGEGPFTVFAPTDEAFAKLPEGTVEALLKDTGKLKSILLYHVVAGEVLAADAAKLDSAKTLQGQTVRIRTSSPIRVDDAKVIKTDVRAANGVIHVIDAVLLPE
jgi:uncharacterized surface protein with fasciclin (FAS1) repeats